MQEYRIHILEEIKKQGNREEKKEELSLREMLEDKTPKEQVEMLTTIAEVMKVLANQRRLEGVDDEETDTLTAISVIAKRLARKIQEREMMS